MESYIELSNWQVALAATLVCINGAVSVLLRLGIERRLLLASVRMTVQLFAVGFVLHWVFSRNEWAVVVSLMTVMTFIAATSAIRRSRYRFPGMWISSLVSMWTSSWIITALAIVAIVRVEPWYEPQYVIPFLGMVLGNTLNGISLGLDRFANELYTRRDQVETLLALGATRWEAARLPIREALRTSLTPIINVMMVAGIVNLPGMMTGQLLAGVEPAQAVKYQIVILFLIASGTALGSVGIVLLSYLRLFSPEHRFLHQRLKVER